MEYKKSTNLENEKVTKFNYWGLCSGLKWYMHNVHGTANFKNKVIVHKEEIEAEKKEILAF